MDLGDIINCRRGSQLASAAGPAPRFAPQLVLSRRPPLSQTHNAASLSLHGGWRWIKQLQNLKVPESRFDAKSKKKEEEEMVVCVTHC